MNKNSKYVCEKPFIYIETHIDGNITICCPAYVNGYTIGNFFEENTFEKIWNGEKAKEFRASVIDSSYKYCNLDLCTTQIKGERQKRDFSTTAKNYPLEIKFCHDRQCNALCRICRDKQIYTDKKKEEKLNNLIDSFFLPMLKDARLVWLNGAGEIFASNHMKTLTKAIVQKFPNIKFGIHSNGILFDKKNCDELGITDKIALAEVSIHAATKETYDKIIRNGNFNKVLQNITWLADLKKQNKILELNLDFVITSINYKEMRNFQKLANRLNCNTIFTTYRPWESEWASKYDELAIFEPKHPDHKKFRRHLNNKIFLSKNCKMQNSLLKIVQEETTKEKSIIKKFIEKISTIINSKH